jgi:hypothetical protein
MFFGTLLNYSPDPRLSLTPAQPLNPYSLLSPVGQLVCQSASSSFSQLVGWSVRLSAGRLISQLVSWLVSLSVDWLVGQSIGWLISLRFQNASCCELCEWLHSVYLEGVSYWQSIEIRRVEPRFQSYHISYI